MARDFEDLIEENEDFDLVEACLLIGQDIAPDLDVAFYLNEIEEMAARLLAAVGHEAGPEDRIVALNQLLFNTLGFVGNRDDYYDPRNSYLHEVIDRRAGIPITLSVLYLELGWRIGLPLQGVSFPGHFLVQLPLRDGMLVLDPFSSGAALSADALRALLKRVVQGAGRSDDTIDALPLSAFLEPATKRDILARVLRNLRSIYREQTDTLRELEVLDRLVVVQPEDHAVLRDRGLAFYQLEAYRAALEDVSEYLACVPDASDARQLRALLVELTQRCAQLN